MKKLLLMLAMSLAALPLSAQYRQNRTIKIWDNASAPHSNELSGGEYMQASFRLANTVDTEIYVYDPDPEKRTGLAIMLCPGGGYGRLALDTEGFMPAEWLASNGIAAYVLKYRMPNGHPEVPLEDAVEALRTIRRDGREQGAEFDKVGIMGFSAGGHLAAYTSNFAPAEERPDFAVLFYPVISCDSEAIHKGSFDNLLGSDRTAEMSERYSMERCVSEQTPTTLLLLSDNDKAVPPAGSAWYYAALKHCGVKASMTIFPTGGHGWGDRPTFAYRDEWHSLLLRWLAQLK